MNLFSFEYECADILLSQGFKKQDDIYIKDSLKVRVGVDYIEFSRGVGVYKIYNREEEFMIEWLKNKIGVK